MENGTKVWIMFYRDFPFGTEGEVLDEAGCQEGFDPSYGDWSIDYYKVRVGDREIVVSDAEIVRVGDKGGANSAYTYRRGRNLPKDVDEISRSSMPAATASRLNINLDFVKNYQA